MKIAVFVLLALFCLAFGKNNLPRKQNAGPPSEFGEYTIPDPKAGAIVEKSSYIEFYLSQKGATNYVASTTQITVDSDQLFAFAISSPSEDQLQVKLTDPSGNVVDVSSHATKGSIPVGSSFFVPATSYVFSNPQVGVWNLQLTSNTLSAEQIKKLTSSEPDGVIIVYNQSPIRIYTHLNTYNLVADQNIGLVAAVTEQQNIIRGRNAVFPTPMQAEVVLSADMEVVMPDGSVVDVPMHDDGLHSDGAANDGIWGGYIQATETGIYSAEAKLNGQTSQGVSFARTSTHLIQVVKDNLELTGAAVAEQLDESRINLHIGVSADNLNSDSIYRAYAEVWGVDPKDNTPKAIAWVSSMVDVENNPALGQAVTLQLNLNWAALGQVKAAPLTLKNVFIQEGYSFVPVSQMETIPVKIANARLYGYLLRYHSLNTHINTVTKEMRVGKKPVSLKPKVNATVDASVLLVHGYCSSVNPWSGQPADWTNPQFFLNANSNVENQVFGDIVAKYIEEHSLDKFSWVGHSQGGMVGLHLYNHYFTGMDDVEGGRILQSIGTPYLGCSAAGSAANLGKLFGVGCGANDDLTTDGAALWLSSITNEHANDVYYYTTTYEQGTWFGDYCSMAMNMVLEWPNDGTTELENAQLTRVRPVAHNAGNIEKWCHTTEMAYPAQYINGNLNKQMNKDAAR